MQDSQIVNKKFKFAIPLLTKSKDFKEATRDEFGCKHIQFGLSTTVPDLQGDTMTPNALNKMVDQLKANPIVINDGHNHSIKDEMGPTTNAWVDGTDLIVDLRVRKMWENEIEDVLNARMPLGGSIEGTALKTIFQKSFDGEYVLKKEIIDDLELYAGALTTIPAAWNLRGTAKSKSLSENDVPTMCAQIQKSLDMNVVKIKKSDYVVNPTCLNFARTEIKAGNIDNGTWNKPVFSDFNNDIDEYKKYALAVHPDMDPKLSGSYGFEIGKNGKISRQGVITAKVAAAGGLSAAGKNTELYDAAEELLQLIDDQTNNSITKSIGDEPMGEIVDLSQSFEAIKDDINDALDDKYATPDGYGGKSRNCWIRYTNPDMVFVSTYGGGNDLYQIPYTRDPETLEVTLGDYSQTTLQAVLKAIEDSKWMFKSIEPKNRGGKVKGNNLDIPKDLEGMDEGIIKKIKEGGDEVKQFFKGLLGIEEPGLEPEPNSGAGNPAPTANGGVVVDKGISKKEIQKMINEGVDEKTKDMKKSLDTLITENKNLKHKALVKTALDLHKKVSPTPDDETDMDESDFLKSLVEDGFYTQEEVDENPDACIKMAIKGMEIGLKKTPEGPLPHLDGSNINEINKDSKKYVEISKDYRAKLDKMGTE